MSRLNRNLFCLSVKHETSFLILAHLDTEGNILAKFLKNPTSGLGGDEIARTVYRRAVGRTTDAGEFPGRKATSRRANNIKKGPQKGPHI